MPSLRPTSLDAPLTDLEERITTESPSSDTTTESLAGKTVTPMIAKPGDARNAVRARVHLHVEVRP